MNGGTDVTFEQLDYFIAVVKSETFLEAAETLHISQSTLSKQIMKLEQELNLTLFDRSHRCASLTSAGKMFYKEALQLSGAYHQAMLRVRTFQELGKMELHIGILPILNQYKLAPLLREFSASHTDIHLSMAECEEIELLDGLTNKHFDLVIARRQLSSEHKHCFYPLANDRLVAVLPINHPLAAKTSINIRELANEQFILMKPHTSVYQYCMQLFEQEHLHPHIVRTARLESILGAIVLGEGISLTPEGNYQMFINDNVVSVPLEAADNLTVGIIYNKSDRMSLPAAEFLKFIDNLSKV
jgi:DNA-binding transcriptional LysR family regulator